jgi:uncharacterized protein (DUF2062 family)
VKWIGTVSRFCGESARKHFSGLQLEGLSVGTIALTIALGLVLGVFPVYGFPTIFCTVAAIVLRLNLPALQLVNYLASPLQLAMLVPFARVGERLLPACAIHPAKTVPGSFHANIALIVSRVWNSVIHAIAGWFCVCIPFGILLYLILGYVLRRRRRVVRFSIEALEAPAA